jgi:long-chain acyl-CoA synthetase
VERQIPLCGAVPTMYAILLSLPDLDRFDLSCLKIVFLSGEKVALELLQGVHDRICPHIVVGYGSTEAGAEATFTEPGDALELLASGYVGKPQPGVRIAIVDENDRPLAPGEVGDVLIGGPLTIPGYFRMPEEDAAGFTEDGMCRTGDLGHVTESGALVIQGRKKQIIRVGSYTVLASEVEEVALTQADVAVAAAVGIPHEIYGEVVWLVVAPVEGKEIDVDAVRELCEGQLADFKVPRRIEVRERMPMSRIGKIDRVLLKTELLERQ